LDIYIIIIKRLKYKLINIYISISYSYTKNNINFFVWQFKIFHYINFKNFFHFILL